jgi:hypothetical protein
MTRLITLAALAALLSLTAVGIAFAGTDDPDLQATGMNGAQEVPGPGDPDGAGSAALDLKLKKGEVCWQLLWSNLSTVTAAHIHKGAKGVFGDPKVIFFEGVNDNGSGASGCTEASKPLLRKLDDKPKSYYVNIHTTQFSAGAVRGQLKPG